MAEMKTEEGGHPSRPLQRGHVHVEVHAVDALQFHHDMFFLELGEAVGYFHDEFRLGICSPEYGATAACRLHSSTSGCCEARPDSSFGRR